MNWRTARCSVPPRSTTDSRGHSSPTTCYRLRELHREIRHDLPHVHDGLLATWRDIAAIRRAEERDPACRPDPFASNCRCAGWRTSDVDAADHSG